MYAGGILPRLLAFSPREKAACMPVPEGRMRATPILPQHLICEKLAPLAKDGGGPIPTWGIQSQVGPPILMAVPNDLSPSAKIDTRRSCARIKRSTGPMRHLGPKWPGFFMPKDRE